MERQRFDVMLEAARWVGLWPVGETESQVMAAVARAGETLDGAKWARVKRTMSVCDLSSLRAGDLGTVVGIDAAHSSAKRLADMGFVRGVRLEMVRPGRPCIVRIDGSCVGLGGAHQQCVSLVRTV